MERIHREQKSRKFNLVSLSSTLQLIGLTNHGTNNTVDLGEMEAFLGFLFDTRLFWKGRLFQLIGEIFGEFIFSLKVLHFVLYKFLLHIRNFLQLYHCIEHFEKNKIMIPDAT